VRQEARVEIQRRGAHVGAQIDDHGRFGTGDVVVLASEEDVGQGEQLGAIGNPDVLAAAAEPERKNALRTRIGPEDLACREGDMRRRECDPSDRPVPERRVAQRAAQHVVTRPNEPAETARGADASTRYDGIAGFDRCSRRLLFRIGHPRDLTRRWTLRRSYIS
jgi:hypothetical protein